MSGKFRNAFCAIRPPGHHAGPQGCVVSDYYWKHPEMSSNGFCLLNTVAVAAAYARYHYGSMASRVSLTKALTDNRSASNACEGNGPKIAIVDIDVHHGNGTEEIVKNLSPHLSFLPLPSSWAPVSQMSYKPWLNEQDAYHVLFASINLFADDRFYPCSGSDSHSSQKQSAADNKNIINIGLTPLGPGPWNQTVRSKLTQHAKAELCAAAALEFRIKVSTVLLPRLRDFQADVIFISAGFDAHVDDFYHFLQEEDFHWITSELCAIADEADGVVISVLEGGYSLACPVPGPVPAAACGRETRGGKKAASPPINVYMNPSENPNLKFAQLPGDGGLVKGVLAHAAGLAGMSAWIE